MHGLELSAGAHTGPRDRLTIISWVTVVIRAANRANTYAHVYASIFNARSQLFNAGFHTSKAAKRWLDSKHI
jgi:hypothetical protein